MVKERYKFKSVPNISKIWESWAPLLIKEGLGLKMTSVTSQWLEELGFDLESSSPAGNLQQLF